MENINNFVVSNSTEREDYEVLIKENDVNSFSAYCPQMNLLVKNIGFDEVYADMDKAISEHIKSIMPD